MVIGGEDGGRKKKVTSITILRMSFRFQNSTFLLGRFSAVLYVSLFLFLLYLLGWEFWLGFLSFYVLLPLMFSFWCPFFFMLCFAWGCFFVFFDLPIASSYIVVSFHAFFLIFSYFFNFHRVVGG